MPDHEPVALWEESLEGPDTGSLADEIVALARSWAGDDPERLKEAERILAGSRYLGTITCPRCGMPANDPRHEELPDGCRAHVVYGEGEEP